MKSFGEMTEKEIRDFSKNFYEIWEEHFPATTMDCGLPVDQWGRPCDWCPQREVVTPEAWWEETRAEIERVIEEGRKARLEAFADAAQEYYRDHAGDDDGRDWTEGKTGYEWGSIDEARECGEESAAKAMAEE